MKYVTLNNNVKMPILGFGAYIENVEDSEQIFREAIEIGYRHFDTAQLYKNEEALGRVLSESNIAREEFFITTKVNTSGYEATKKQIDKALDVLQTSYVDLMLVHWVIDDYEGTYQALVEGYKEGKLRAIGVSNFNEKQIEGLIKKFAIVPAVVQNEMHILRQQQKMRIFAEEKNIQFESWAPFGEGVENIFKHPIITKIGGKYNKTVAQVILRFLIQEKVIVIPKSTNVGRMAQNFDIFDFELSDEDVATLRSLNEERGLFSWNE